MSLTLVTDVGSATANSYASLDEFKLYVSTRPPTIPWALAPNIDQTMISYLIAACRELDVCFNWTGIAVSSTQVLCWPRSGMLTLNKFAIDPTTIPQPLKNAQCELALQLGSSDLLADDIARKANVANIKAGSVGINFQAVNSSTIESVDIQVRKQGARFNAISGAIPDEVRRLLVPSWFKMPEVRRRALFSNRRGHRGGGSSEIDW